VEKIDKLALIVKNPAGIVLDKRVKPYEVFRVSEVQEVPEPVGVEEEVVKQSRAENKRAVRKDRALKKEFDEVEDGKVVIPQKLVPVREKRVIANVLGVGSRVQAKFKVGKVFKNFQGTIQKVNPHTYVVLFDDGDKLHMKKSEVEKIPEV
jgi:mRNA-degrading endonuclease HigB of HigAB toxin-antitoxin module